jgi:hypothetical protein
LDKKRGRVRERERARNPNAGELVISDAGDLLTRSLGGFFLFSAGAGASGRKRGGGGRRRVQGGSDGEIECRLAFLFFQDHAC